MVQGNVVLGGCLFVVFSLFSVSHCQYLLSCQPVPQVQFYHLVDTSLDMRGFFDLAGGGFRQFEDWANGVFSQNFTSGIGTFAERSQNCYTTEQDLGSHGVSDIFLQLANNLVSPPADKRDVYDGIVGAANEFVKSPYYGRKIIIVYTSELPQDHQSDVTDMPFNGDIDCNNHDLPSMDDLISYFNTGRKQDIRIVFVVPSRLISGYRELFSWLDHRLSVVSLTNDSNEFFMSLFYAMDEIYCNAPPPSTPVSPDVCAMETVLQLLHLQDFSWSYTNDLSDLKAKMADLLQGLEDRFYERQVALGTFVDKPIAPSGYPGDYCYREDSVFSTDANLFIHALNNATIKSGSDWHESQYDAVLYGIKSLTLGWTDNASAAVNRNLLRVVMLATDAGPHRKGDLSDESIQQNQQEMSGCESEDYPSDEDIRVALEEYNVYPIFLVTRDIVQYYINDVLNKISKKGKVISLHDDIDNIIQTIISATEEFCVDSMLS